MKKTISLLFLAVLLSFCSEEKKLLRKGSNAVDQSDFDKALGCYDKLIQKDKNSFYGNAGKGIVLSEYMGRHEQAIPYLEKALTNVPKKSETVINGNLGKSYHFIGNYKRALLFYSKISDKNSPEFSDYDEFLTKRIADCRYAIEHPKVALPENESITNVGNVVNTDMPEYTPVVANGNLLFTSKRKDTPKEKKNGEDGKYFESIYISAINNNGTFSAPKRYKLPKTALQLRKYGESVMSVSPDGKKLYIYKGGKIYETDSDDPNHQPEKLSKTVNFAVQNHASLAPDGKTLYFSAEARDGRGGSDIYTSVRTDDGKWSEPKILGNSVNTTNDEDSPFINEKGVLFFSSNGHPGYGGFDVYKSYQVNGQWVPAENLGQPINSPGDEVYFALNNNTSNGYFASARPGGVGDLDIYKVHYILTETPECVQDSLLVINASPEPNNHLVQNIELTVPETYKNNVRSYRWELNGQELAQTTEKFQHTFTKADTYKLSARLTVYCDTCPALQAMCAEKTIVIPETILTMNKAADKLNRVNKTKTAVATTKNAKTTGAIAGKDVTKTADKNKNGEGNEMNNSTKKDNVAGNMARATNEQSDKGTRSGNNSTKTYLSENELKALNWNATPSYFGFNAYKLTEEAKVVLNQNLDILKNKNQLYVTINAYTDSRGSGEYNKRLSERRANSVKHFLISNGIKRKRIKANGMGETQLVNNCGNGIACDESQHQQNRRVELKVSEGPVKKATLITLK